MSSPVGTANAGRRHLLDGTAWGFIAEALALPSGLLTVAYLTRLLGAADYGRYSLAVALVLFLESALAALLSRATIKFVSQAEDWRPVARTVLRVNLGLGIAVALVLAALAPMIAAALGEPGLTPYIQFFALDLPIVGVAQAHQQTLIGVGRYRARAATRAARWIARPILIVLGVELGFGVLGALAGSIGGTLAELVIARTRIRPSLRGVAVPARPVLALGMPLFLAGLAMGLLRKVDLFALQSLGGSVADAGFYAAAQNIALVPDLLAFAFAPLLLSSMSRALHRGDAPLARRLADDFLRAVAWLLPFAALVAAEADGIARLVYGARFTAAAPILAVLVFAGIALVFASVLAAVLIALDRPGWTTAMAVTSLAAALAAFPVLIPRYGPVGAAASTTLGATLGVAVGAAAVRHLWRLALPVSTFLRAAAVTLLVYGAASLWRTTGVWLLLELMVLGGGTLLLLGVLDDTARTELLTLRRRLTSPSNERVR